MTLGNICRCEFVKLCIFPGRTDDHLSNLDQKKPIMPRKTAIHFSLEKLCYPYWGNQQMLEKWEYH